MGLELDYTDGKTPLDEDEKEGLRIKTITTRGELDEFEQQNIEKALLWLRKKKLSAKEILSEKFVRNLHQKMYADVWKWAGDFRKTNKNIGIDKYQIGIELKQLLDDCLYWIAQRNFPEEEIAIRLKHRIVQIHCFTNGNGRHSRLLGDVLAEKVFRLPPFTWGAANLVKHGDPRSAYLKALKKADAGDYAELVAFAKS
jgi:Fic-DOC domain mobile mystery protein B